MELFNLLPCKGIFSLEKEYHGTKGTEKTIKFLMRNKARMEMMIQYVQDITPLEEGIANEVIFRV